MRRLLKASLAAISYVVGSYYFAHVPFSLWLWVLHAAVSWPLWALETLTGQRQGRERCPGRCRGRKAPGLPRSPAPPASPQFPLGEKREGGSCNVDAANLDQVQAGEVVARDGTRLHYQVIEGDAEDAPVMLFCNGLGGFQFHIFRPVVMHFGRKFTYITWDYRGLFGSERPASIRRMAVSEHAHDAAEVLAACGRERADVLLGWSMGVQVGLEFALLYPEKATHLVLVNGAHGQVFHSGFQPLVRLPIVHDVVRAGAAYLATHPYILRTLRRLALPLIPTVVRLYVWLLGSRLLKQSQFFGKRYMEKTLVDLLDHICHDEKTMETYLWLFQELNAHSVYHLLGSVQQRTLLISGLFDMLLPAYHMWEMERRMPHARHVCDYWSAHFTLLEHPEVVLQHMQAFLADQGLLDARAQAPSESAEKILLPQPKAPPAQSKASAVQGERECCAEFGRSEMKAARARATAAAGARTAEHRRRQRCLGA